EQTQGATLDRRSDIFSLGVVLYELTTGTHLFEAESEIVTVQNVARAAIPPPSKRRNDYPPALERIVLRALEQEPGNRFATAEEMQLALEELAREHRLPVSTTGLAHYVNRRFEGDASAWRAAQRAGQTLVEFLSTSGGHDEWDLGDIGTITEDISTG